MEVVSHPQMEPGGGKLGMKIAGECKEEAGE
jgi:hypothetical protein